MLAPQYVRSPIGISKFFVLVASAATLILSGSTRPTELQDQIVNSTWKEDGLFFLSISGIMMTLMSVASSIIFRKQCEQHNLIMKEICVFAIGCVAFMIFGFGTLESALSIFTRVGDCCEDTHFESNNTCTLPGFILDTYHMYTNKAIKPLPAYIDDVSKDVLIEFPNIPECNNGLEYNSWECTVCINELIQPMFEMKGAAGAAGIIAGMAYFIVVFVAIREKRKKKPSLSSAFRND